MVEKSITRKKKSPRGSSNLVGITLIHTDIDFADAAPTEEVFEFDYEVSIEDFDEIMPELFACTVDLAIKRSESASKRLSSRFAASYYCGFRVKNLGRDEALESAKRYAATSIWASFSALSAVATSQMGIAFPVLPPSPGVVKVVESAHND